MANDSRYYHEPSLEPGPNYKMLFMGACALISILAGSLYGLWTSRAEQTVEDSRTTNDLQWQRLQQLSDKLLEHGAQLQQLRREGDDREGRVRELERSIARAQRERGSH